ncbi:MAG TPA: hypothetical protein VHM90_03750 [Phycisphaerae bacterium]|nr:hypothetical protein [Phycisphaerae bacterium]
MAQTTATTVRRRRFPVLFAVGLALLIFLQAAHFGNVLGLTQQTPMAFAAAVIRANITPLAWCAYLVFLVGYLAWRDGRSWLWRHCNRFAMCWLWSVPAWCYFDWMNFYFMRDPATGLRAWEYHNLPPRFEDRLAGYLVAFGAIAPGMFLTAEVLQRLGLNRISARREKEGPGKMDRLLPRIVLGLGMVLAPIPVLFGTPLSNLAIWVGTWALLDPINFWLGRPSIVRDWLAGRFGRTLALGAGGLACGFLWEFWNFWAGGKWTYHLAFLGSWQQTRYFEMPVPGLIGFVAFGIETWTMWQTALLLLSPFVEGERKTGGDRYLNELGCF